MTKGLKERLKEKRLDHEAYRKGVFPLAAYYGREPEFEVRRNGFYASMAKVYGWEKKAKPIAVDSRVGRDGRPAEIASIGRERAMPVITNSAPLEYLFSKGMLQGREDTHGAAYRRLSAGLRLRGILEGSEISGLRAANLEGSSGGGMPGRLPGEYKMDCIRWLSEVRGPEKTGGMPPALFSLLEDIVYQDRWIWEKLNGDRREALMLRLHRALDLLSVRLMMMSKNDFQARWFPVQRHAKAQGSSEKPPSSPD